MLTVDRLATGTRIEFRSFLDWKGYASAMGYHADTQAAQRPGFCRMRRDIGLVTNIPCPPCFAYEIVDEEFQPANSDSPDQPPADYVPLANPTADYEQVSSAYGI